MSTQKMTISKIKISDNYKFCQHTNILKLNFILFRYHLVAFDKWRVRITHTKILNLGLFDKIELLLINDFWIYYIL